MGMSRILNFKNGARGPSLIAATDSIPHGAQPPIIPGAPTHVLPIQLPNPKMTPIDMDRLTTLWAINSKERNRYLREWVDSELMNGRELSEEKRQALEFLSSHTMEDPEMTEAEKEFWTDFIWWLIGKPRNREEWVRTDWLKKMLSAGYDEFGANLAYKSEDIREFLSLFTDAKHRFESQIDELKLKGPTSLTEAYLYYKYIVKGNNTDYLSDLNDFLSLGRPRTRPPNNRVPVRPAPGDAVPAEAPPPARDPFMVVADEYSLPILERVADTERLARQILSAQKEKDPELLSIISRIDQMASDGKISTEVINQLQQRTQDIANNYPQIMKGFETFGGRVESQLISLARHYDARINDVIKAIDSSKRGDVEQLNRKIQELHREKEEIMGKYEHDINGTGQAMAARFEEKKKMVGAAHAARIKELEDKIRTLEDTGQRREGEGEGEAKMRGIAQQLTMAMKSNEQKYNEIIAKMRNEKNGEVQALRDKFSGIYNSYVANTKALTDELQNSKMDKTSFEFKLGSYEKSIGVFSREMIDLQNRYHKTNADKQLLVGQISELSSKYNSDMNQMVGRINTLMTAGMTLEQNGKRDFEALRQEAENVIRARDEA